MKSKLLILFFAICLNGFINVVGVGDESSAGASDLLSFGSRSNIRFDVLCLRPFIILSCNV